eukprot:420413_1
MAEKIMSESRQSLERKRTDISQTESLSAKLVNLRTHVVKEAAKAVRRRESSVEIIQSMLDQENLPSSVTTFRASGEILKSVFGTVSRRVSKCSIVDTDADGLPQRTCKDEQKVHELVSVVQDMPIYDYEQDSGRRRMSSRSLPIESQPTLKWRDTDDLGFNYTYSESSHSSIPVGSFGKPATGVLMQEHLANYVDLSVRRCSPGTFFQARSDFLENSMSFFAAQVNFLEKLVKINANFMEELESNVQEYVDCVDGVVKPENAGSQSMSAAILGSQAGLLLFTSRLSSVRTFKLVEDLKMQYNALSHDVKTLKTISYLAQEKLKNDERLFEKSAMKCRYAADIFEAANTELKAAQRPKSRLVSIASSKYKSIKAKLTRELKVKQQIATARCDEAVDVWMKHKKITQKLNEHIHNYHSKIVPAFIPKLDALIVRVKSVLFVTLAKIYESRENVPEESQSHLEDFVAIQTNAARELKSRIEQEEMELQEQSDTVDPKIYFLDSRGSTDPDDILIKRPYFDRLEKTETLNN